MSLVETLLDTASQDTGLLIKNDGLGDDFSISRDIDFLLIANEMPKAEILCSFINDNNYGSAHIEQAGSEFRVLVTINMPSTQNLVCSVSALMACISHLFDVQYDGWGCVLQTNA